MILLTDEEIEPILKGTDTSGKAMPEGYDEWILPDGFAEFIAKAQLKKVVEWLKGYNFGETKIADDAINSVPYFIIPPGEWQALLEEMECH